MEPLIWLAILSVIFTVAAAVLGLGMVLMRRSSWGAAMTELGLQSTGPDAWSGTVAGVQVTVDSERDVTGKTVRVYRAALSGWDANVEVGPIKWLKRQFATVPLGIPEFDEVVHVQGPRVPAVAAMAEVRRPALLRMAAGGMKLRSNELKVAGGETRAADIVAAVTELANVASELVIDTSSAHDLDVMIRTDSQGPPRRTALDAMVELDSNAALALANALIFDDDAPPGLRMDAANLLNRPLPPHVVRELVRGGERNDLEGALAAASRSSYKGAVADIIGVLGENKTDVAIVEAAAAALGAIGTMADIKVLEPFTSGDNTPMRMKLAAKGAIATLEARANGPAPRPYTPKPAPARPAAFTPLGAMPNGGPQPDDTRERGPLSGRFHRDAGFGDAAEDPTVRIKRADPEADATVRMERDKKS
jgi:hypothetical protein